MNRRKFLVGAAAATTTALAGCSGILGNDFGAARDPWSDSQDTDSSNSHTDRGRVTLPENKYATLTYTNQIPFNLVVKVNAGKPMDVYLLDSTEFNRYRDGKEFQISDYSAEDTERPRFSGRVNAGKWYIVFDNTDIGTRYDGEVEAGYAVQQSV